MFRGNIVMKGYLKNTQGDATRRSLAAGSIPAISACCTRTATSSCKDRSKDIIISGGENISSIEVEDALYKHPAVAVLAAWWHATTTNGARRRLRLSSN